MPILEWKADQSAIRSILQALSALFLGTGRISRDPGGATTGPGHVTASRQRLAEAVSRLQLLDAERERRGDPRFGKTSESRIVWGELIDLELQEIDEQVSRICAAAGATCRQVGSRTVGKEVLMNTTTHESLNLGSEELAVLAELLESERAKLLIEIRHTHHRSFRDELRHRVGLVEALQERCGQGLSGDPPAR